MAAAVSATGALGSIGVGGNRPGCFVRFREVDCGTPGDRHGRKADTAIDLNAGLYSNLLILRLLGSQAFRGLSARVWLAASAQSVA
jgi:hypothetical protein